jgi:cell division protein FtsQ
MKSQSTQKYKKYGKKVRPKLPMQLIYSLKIILAVVIMGISALVIFPNNLALIANNFYEEQTSKLNFKIESIIIEGTDKISEQELQALTGIKLGSNIMNVDLTEVKSRMETQPWVASAVVERILPSTISINLTEEVPQAIYVEENKKYLVNRKGRKLQEVIGSDYQDYLTIEGNHANLKFDGVLDQLYNFQNTYKKVESLHFKGNRRWDVKLKNGILIKLPETNINEALEVFEKNFGKISKLYKTCIVDLRLIPDKIYLKMIN